MAMRPVLRLAEAAARPRLLVLALVFLAVNLLVDVLYGWLDPRISFR